MSFSWLSILGVYEWDNTILDDITVPSSINKQEVIDNILIECAELELIYTEPSTLRRAIKIWSDSNQSVWNKLQYTVDVEYEPIWNVDANITQEETNDGISERDIDRNTTLDETIDITDVKSVKGFNSNTWAESEKNHRSGSDDTEGRETVTEGIESENTRKYAERRTGNIGVTATQDLINKEREVAQFNMIEFITNSFKHRFCVMVY